MTLDQDSLAARLRNWPADISVEQFLQIAYDMSKTDAQEKVVIGLLIHLIARLDEGRSAVAR
ncbi:MAG: hypothetical protein SV862_14565 [Pseudomonadota bacterium]|nr:hypothetical protein [Pseudomonadota bacterium]